MILRRIRLNNFRQYAGDQSVHFAGTGEQNVTVIEGVNGAGKSGLFKALNWCLYGEAADDETMLSKVTDADTGWVEVHFRYAGRDYSARRTVARTGNFETFSDLHLERVEGGGKVKSLPNPSQHMNTVLPADARRYFFFDGERIDEMSKPQHAAQITAAVRAVLKLEILERAVSHLDKAESDLAKSARQLAQTSEHEAQLLENIEAQREQQRALKVMRDELTVQMGSMEGHIHDKRAALNALHEVQALTQKDETLAERLNDLEDDRQGEVTRIREGIMEAAPALIRRALTVSSNILDEKRARGEIPSSLRQSLVDDLLKVGSCICDRELDQAARDALELRRDSAVSTALEETVQLAAGRITSLHLECDARVERLRQGLTELQRVIDKAGDVARERDEIRQRIRTDFSSDVKEAERELDDAEQQFRSLQVQFDRAGWNAETLVKQTKELEKQLSEVASSSREMHRARRRYELARQAAEACARILEEFREDARGQIAEYTSEVFHELIWKEKQFERVHVTESYTLDVIDRWGRSALADLSAGERQMLSLAFLIGMSRISADSADGDHSAPFVVDTPLGRISKQVRQNVAEMLPNFAPQLVLLVTDTELTGVARATIEHRIGAEYKLIFDEDSGATSIEEVV